MRGRLEEDRPRGRDAAGLRETFESAADGYDAARPSYPKQLFDDLVELAELRPRARLLEIGCATGKATRPLLERGFSVVCVELGVRLAKRARANLAGMPAEIHVAPFEVWENEGHPFDLVYAATAWHWIDPAIRYRKAYELLRPTGHLAFWSAQHAFPVDYDPSSPRSRRSTTPSAKTAPESGRLLHPVGSPTMLRRSKRPACLRGSTFAGTSGIGTRSSMWHAAYTAPVTPAFEAAAASAGPPLCRSARFRSNRNSVATRRMWASVRESHPSSDGDGAGRDARWSASVARHASRFAKRIARPYRQE